MINVSLTQKQKDYINNAKKRYNIKGGATRSGKTYLDLIYTLPNMFVEVAKKDGLNVILGTTKGTINRNIIQPLKKIWGDKLVGDINAQNEVVLFGQTVYCLGANKVNSVDVLRGSSVKRCYCDELATYHEEVINMMISRLDKPYSQLHGTYNPTYPTHWLKKFIDKGDDSLYHQEYNIYDNSFLTDDVRDTIVRLYKGTVYFDRYVLGKWKRVEGVIYKEYADNVDDYDISIDDLPTTMAFNIGIDYGKSKSNNAVTATGIHNNKLYVLYAGSVSAQNKTTTEIERDINERIDYIKNKYPYYNFFMAYGDSAEPVINNDLATKYNLPMRASYKMGIRDRIRATNILIGDKRLFLVKGECEPLKEALQEAVWDDKKDDDVRLDDGSYNVDILDSFEYSFERDISTLVRFGNDI